MQGLRGVLRPLQAAWPGLWPFALALLFTSAYFIGSPAWNQNSRFALTRALVEDHSVIIDRFHETTGDKSFYRGHFYSDKAPGMSFLAVPAYALFYAAKRISGGELPDCEVIPLDPLDAVARRIPSPDQRQPGDRLSFNQAHRVALYLCTLSTTVVIGLAGTAAFFLLALRQLGGDRRSAALLTGAYALGTPALVYGTAFYGHHASGSFLFMAFAMVALSDRTEPPGVLPWLVGSSLGLAVWCEYPSAIPALIVVLYAARRRGLPFAAWTIVAGLPWAIALGAYHEVAFGHPWVTGYDHVYLQPFADGMREAYGIGRPDPRALHELLFGSYRGLFYLSPLLLLAAWGLALGLARGTTGPATLDRWATATAVAIVGFYIVLNGGYYMWDGGSAFGPRHMVPMIPFLALGLAPALRTVPWAFRVLAVVSVVHMVLGTAATPEAPRHGNPLWQFAWFKVLAAGTSEDLGATNVGRLLGIPGVFSLAPLLALWGWLGPLARDGFKSAERTTSPLRNAPPKAPTPP